ncbi:hypothetical protein ASE75_05755 [Sphingomonas sp. Leaf17]|nr:hypothetical protein ASE75_05755 [Sphingomonas sp. Leaf17]
MVMAGMAAGPAQAKDVVPCEKDMICASDPTSVAAAMMKAGYQALISKDATGDPMIESAAAGYTFTVYFYGCEKAVQCDSIQLYASFKSDGRDAAFANQWNMNKRFMQMSISKSGSVEVRYDLATIGGVNRKNFGDVLDWWSAMLGELGKYFDANPVAAKAGAAAPSPGKTAPKI